MDHDVIVYIEEQCSESSLSSSLIIPHSLLDSPLESFARCEIICPWVTSGCYNTTQEKGKNLGSKVIDNMGNMLHQHVPNKVPASSPPFGSNIFNIQLNYNINQALDPGSWNGEFHAVSLHSSMEHLVSDIKNIKESLWQMGSYIKAKSVSTNSNDVKDLEGVSKEL